MTIRPLVVRPFAIRTFISRLCVIRKTTKDVAQFTQYAVRNTQYVIILRRGPNYA